MPKVSDAHRDARRRQIIDAALACFARQGFHRTSMNEIIAEAGLSAGAIYRYFRAKDEIVAAIAEERHARESAMLAAAMAQPDLRQGLHELAHAYFEWLRDPKEKRRRRVTVQVWAEALRSEPIAAIVREGMAQRAPAVRAFRAAQRRGALASSLDPDSLARFVLAVVQGFILQQAWEPKLVVDGYLAVVDQVIDALFSIRHKP